MGIGRAIRFLRDAQVRGAWRDFDTLAGASDEWVTAYVAVQLAHVDREESRDAAHRALRWLLRRRLLSAGWGYNGRVPADSDSTAWVLQLAARLGVERRRLRRARRFLERSSHADGGIPTFSSSGPIRRYTRLARRISFAGWCDAHTCVTAAVAPVMSGAGRMFEFLRRAQREDGSWSAYWWVDSEYATSLAVNALAKGTAVNEPAVQRAAHWAAERVAADGAVRTALHPDGSPFATALCVLALRFDHSAAASAHALRARAWLSSAQRDDGSWTPSAELRIPPPPERDPDRVASWRRHGRGAGCILHDCNRLFTTATALRALDAFPS